MTAKKRKRKDATFPVGLILNFCKQWKLVTLDISANPSQWSVEFERFIVTGSQSHPNAFQLNAYLDSLAGNIADSIGDYKRRKIPFTNAMLVERLFVVQKTTKLKSYIQQLIVDLDKQKRFGYASTFFRLSLKSIFCNFIIMNLVCLHTGERSIYFSSPSFVGELIL